MKLTIVTVAGKKFAVAGATRILQGYEFRLVPGKTVKALHLGAPLVDLGSLFDGSQNKKQFAIKLDAGFGYLVDSVENEIDCKDEDFSAFPKIIREQKGSLLEGTAKIDEHELVVISSKPNQHLTSLINADLSERSWI